LTTGWTGTNSLFTRKVKIYTFTAYLLAKQWDKHIYSNDCPVHIKTGNEKNGRNN